MKRPDVFSSLYLMSSCCLNASLTFDPGRMAPAEAIKTREAAEEAGRGRGFGPSVNLAEGAAWSPNPKNPPLYLDLPVKDGKLQPDVIAKWAANAPLAMVGAVHSEPEDVPRHRDGSRHEGRPARVEQAAR